MGQFDVLTDIEFEDFVADLVSAVTGLAFVAGARGADGGIDGLNVSGDERHVIQCKHFVRSPFSKLEKAAEREAKRLAGFEQPPASYRFVTSMELSHTQKDKLFEILEPWVKTRENVWGGKELVAALDDHEGVAIHHAKLWFHGAAQLRRQLSAADYNRTSALLDQIAPRIPRFVETEAFADVRRRLEKNRVLLVDGPPGVGKTSLAQLLLLHGVEQGFQPFEIVRGQLRRMWDLLDVDQKQIFYFDDFLGRIAGRETRDEEEELVRFMKAVAADRRRRLVLTTRERILTDAQRESDTLYQEVEPGWIFFLGPQRYTRLERAHMLYNHLHFSPQVDERMKAWLVGTGRHLEVIDHERFSPRAIEWITGFAGHLRNDDKTRYPRFCVEAMGRTAEERWTKPFSELGEDEKALLFSFVGLPQRVGEENLVAAFDEACTARELEAGQDAFRAAVSSLDGTFIEGSETIGRRWWSLLNPSLLDFLERQLLTSRLDSEGLLGAACFYDQVEWLWDAWRRSDVLPPEHLWPAFDEALSRVFFSPSLESTLDLYGESDPTWELEKRLRQAVGWCEEERLRELFSKWLPGYAYEWLEELLEGEPPHPRAVELCIQLVERGMLDRADTERRLKAAIRSGEPTIERWETLHSLMEAAPEILSTDEIAEEKEDLKHFAELAMTQLDWFHEEYGPDGADLLLSVTTGWGVELEEWRTERARAVLQDLQEEEETWKREAEQEGDPDEEEESEPEQHEEDDKEAPSDADVAAEEAQIEAMFQRFRRDE
jgi:hypothetical protein